MKINIHNVTVNKLVILEKEKFMQAISDQYFRSKKVLIADDRPENLEAARACATQSPQTCFEFFSSAKEIIEAIIANPTSIDLIITDRKMETDDAGDFVYAEASARGIPAIILTSLDHHGLETMLFGHSVSLAAHWDTPKDESVTWKIP